MSDKKILIAVPTFESIEADCFKSIYDLIVPKGVEPSFGYVKGYDCARARNNITRQAVDLGYDYVLMVDSDIVLPKKSLEMLYGADKDIIMGWYPKKRDMGGKTELFALSPHIDFDDSCNINMMQMSTNEVMEIKGGGLGCALIKTDVFRKLGSSLWFQYIEYPNGGLLSEDLFFCHNARTQHGYKIFAHTGVRCGHVCKIVQ